jgi:TolB-like protein
MSKIKVCYSFLLLAAFMLVMMKAKAQEQTQSKARVIVLAKIEGQEHRQAMEDAMVRALQNDGIDAITSYQNITENEMKSEDIFIEKLKQLQVTGLVAFTNAQVATRYKRQPSVNAHVGVPVRLGIFRTYLGVDMPIAGGGARAKQEVKLTAQYYNKTSRTSVWSASFKDTYNGDVEALAKKFSERTVKELRKKKIIPGY